MSSPNRRCTFAAAAIAAVLTLGACGSSSNTTTTDNTKPAAAKAAATKLPITTSDAGKGRFKTTAPASIRGGLVTIEFHNAGKQPHEAQLIRLDGGHTAAEAIKNITGSNSDKIPDWLHGAGGVGTIAPGATATTTTNLPAGQYAVLDTGGDNGPPTAPKGALATFTVTSGPSGPLPAHDATIVASTRGMDMYGYKVSGLKAGPNRILFENRSKGQLHHVIAVPMQPGKTLADVKAALAEQGKPSGPPPVDFAKLTNTSVIDGGTSEVTTLNLATPGKWVLLCFLTDRDGGKPHFMEGMLKAVDVK